MNGRYGVLLTFVYASVAYATGMYAFAGSEPSESSAIVSGLFFGAGMAAVVAFQRRRRRIAAGVCDRRTWRQVEASLQTGVLPTDGSVRLGLRAAIPARTIAIQRARRNLPWVSGVLLCIGVLIALSDHPLFLLVPVYLVSIATGRRSLSRQEQRVAKLVVELGGDPESMVPAPAT